MTTRKELFSAKRQAEAEAKKGLVPTTVRHQFSDKDPNYVKGQLRPKDPHEKMICALRKVLVTMSDEAEVKGTRYFIIGEDLRVTNSEITPGAKEGEAGSYRYTGRFKMGVAHGTGESSIKMAGFEISFVDSKDSMGLQDVTYIDPTSIEELPPNTSL